MASDEGRRGRGRPRKLDDFQAFLFRVPTALYEDLAACAEARGVSLNDLLVRVMSDWVIATRDCGPR
ncbi:MAG: hypothetical protein ACR2M1_03630 [Gemmatimonadaceae bacterium]